MTRTVIPVIAPLGEAAYTIRLGDSVSPELADLAASLGRDIAEAAMPAVREIVPAVASVTVFFNPLHPDARDLAPALTALATGSRDDAVARSGATHVIPVRYDGPDLLDVARQTGLNAAEVIARHTGREYQVLTLGFMPGFAYLGPLDPALVLPRRAGPRRRVPAGSVAIAGAQTGVYPIESPGGWHLIGTTEAVLFDPGRTPPALLRAGDRVRFEAVTA